MLPDFSCAAFKRSVLCMLRLRSKHPSKRFFSDYRCQLRFSQEQGTVGLFEVRVFFVGQESAPVGLEVPAVVAFLRAGHPPGGNEHETKIELLEGDSVTATGTIYVFGQSVPSAQDDFGE